MNGKLNRASACRGCGKEIGFIKMVNGKTQPVDPEPVWVRQVYKGKPFIRKDGVYVYGEIAGDAEDDPDTNLIEAYMSHFATCPEAESCRRRGRR